ncbi:MAG: Ig-like domain-containing protein [Gemmatimonadota bacterium]|nr:Ig-like domain-containing protein [Gemmatimonadota bacterium]
MVSPVIVLPSAALLSVGDTLRLSAILGAHCPGGPTTAQWRFKSADAAIAAVDSLTGLVTAVDTGTTFVTAAATFDSTVIGASTIRVLP